MYIYIYTHSHIFTYTSYMYTHTTLYVRIYVYIGYLISRSLSSSASCFQASIPQFYILMFPGFGRKSQILSYIRLCLCYSGIWFINKYFVKINFEVSPMFRQTPYPSMISDVFRWYWNHLMALVTVNTPWPWRSSQAWRHLRRRPMGPSVDGE